MFVTGVSLVVACGYLINSTLNLQSQDKLNHAYQTQLSETSLLADKFNSVLHNSLTEVKQIAALDWNQVSTAGINSTTILQNQKDISRIYVYELSLVSEAQPVLLYKSSNDYGDLEQQAIAQQVVAHVESLAKSKPVVESLATQMESQVGLIVPDTQQLSNGKISIFVALINTQNLFSSVDYNIEVVAKNGELVYASDVKTLIVKNYVAPNFLNQAWANRVNSSTVEYEVNQSKQLGAYVKIDYDLLFISSQPLIKIISSVYVTSQKMIVVGLMALSLALLLAVRLSQSISKPIKNLTQATQAIAQGNFKIKIPHKSNDEMGTLASSFEMMSSKIEKLMVTQKEKIRLENEMNIAATVQKTLFPEKEITLEQVDIVSHYTPASECGGDLWSYFESNNKLYFIIADATGHGLPSALITVATKSTLSLVKRMLENNVAVAPKDILAYANRSVHEVSKGSIMMTCFLGMLDLETGELTFSNAGHNAPWLFSGDKVSALSMAGTRLGEKSEQIEFKEKTVIMKPGDKLFLYTDGIVENTNAQGVMFDKKRVRELVKNSLSKGLKVSLNMLLQEFQKFLGTKKTLDDDTTVVFLELKKLKAKKQLEVA